MRILIIQGSPDSESLSARLAASYASAARRLGHEVQAIDLATVDGFDPVLRFGYRRHMDDEALPDLWQGQVRWAEHLALFFPVWWSAEPAILKGWVDRTLTPRFAYRYRTGGGSEGLLGGRTASIVTSCHGPAAYVRMPGGVISRWKHFVLGFCGIRLTSVSVLGGIESARDDEAYRTAFERKVLATVPRRSSRVAPQMS